jgi:hypothetical protein
MSRGKQGVRLTCAVWAVLLASCGAFDSGKLLPLPNGGNGGMGGAGGTGGMGGSDVDAGPCVPSAEICNGVDDNCDDIEDPNDSEADAYCDATFHAASSCEPIGAGAAQCVRTGECHAGFMNCDGVPSNGCEHEGICRPCPTCEDAGDEDSGDLP